MPAEDRQGGHQRTVAARAQCGRMAAGASRNAAGLSVSPPAGARDFSPARASTGSRPWQGNCRPRAGSRPQACRVRLRALPVSEVLRMGATLLRAELSEMPPASGLKAAGVPGASSRFACEQSSQDGGHPAGDRIVGVLKACLSPGRRELCSRTPKRRSGSHTLKWR